MPESEEVLQTHVQTHRQTHHTHTYAVGLSRRHRNQLKPPNGQSSHNLSHKIQYRILTRSVTKIHKFPLVETSEHTHRGEEETNVSAEESDAPQGCPPGKGHSPHPSGMGCVVTSFQGTVWKGGSTLQPGAQASATPHVTLVACTREVTRKALTLLCSSS